MPQAPRVEPFSLHVPRPPSGATLEALEAALAQAGLRPLRWAIVAADAQGLTLEGACLR